MPLRRRLKELGHKQPPMPMRTDNSTEFGILNNMLKQNGSKAINMRFYWLRDRFKQEKFKIHWDKEQQILPITLLNTIQGHITDNSD